VYQLRQPVSAQDDGSIRPFYPRSAVEYLKGHEIKRTYYVISPGEEQKIQCQSPGGPWNAPNNLVTVTRKYTDGPFADELRSIFYPNGTVELYQYETSGDNQRQTNTVSRGVPNADRTAIVEGTKTVTVIGIGADTISRQVTDVRSGLIIDQEIHSIVNDRTHRVDYLDGSHEMRTYGCCGLMETRVDRTGIQTSFGYDDLDRVILAVRNGITEIQTLDPVGRMLSRTRQGTDGSQIMLVRNTYDQSGRLVAKTDVRTGATTYAYVFDSAGQRVVTATLADGGQGNPDLRCGWPLGEIDGQRRPSDAVW
jgi:YD repeat-containing protein